MTTSRLDSLQEFKKPFARDVKPNADLVSIVKVKITFSCDSFAKLPFYIGLLYLSSGFVPSFGFQMLRYSSAVLLSHKCSEA